MATVLDRGFARLSDPIYSGRIRLRIRPSNASDRAGRVPCADGVDSAVPRRPPRATRLALDWGQRLGELFHTPKALLTVSMQ